MSYTFETWQNKLRDNYKQNDHIRLIWSTYDLEAVVDEDGELLDVCIEGVYMAEMLSHEFMDDVQQRVNEVI